MLISIDSTNVNNAFESSCCFFVFWSQVLTVTTPRSKEFNDPYLVTVKNLVPEVAVSQLQKITVETINESIKRTVNVEIAKGILFLKFEMTTGIGRFAWM